MMLSKSIVATLSLCLVAVYASARPVQQSWSSNYLRVPVTLGVMSRCPDALLCETLFDSVIPRVYEKINLSLAYIATYVPTLDTLQPVWAYRSTIFNSLNVSDPDFGVTCMHGRDECAGNIQQLCVAKHTPMRTWWEFVMCQNYQGRHQIGRADVALKCARTHNIDWEEGEVGKCIGLDGSGRGRGGVHLLHDSIRFAESLGITYVSVLSPSSFECSIVNPTVRVAPSLSTGRRFVFTTKSGNVVRLVIIANLAVKLELIRKQNGHEVKDFVNQIEDAYQKLNGLS